MTLQEIFDTGLAHVRAQGLPSMKAPTSANEASTCAYRGEGGRKCIVGCFIPDDVYDPAWDIPDIGVTIGGGTGVAQLSRRSAAFRDFLRGVSDSPDRPDFLSALQACHDGAATDMCGDEDTKGFLRAFENRMAALARAFDLTYKGPAA